MEQEISKDFISIMKYGISSETEKLKKIKKFKWSLISSESSTNKLQTLVSIVSQKILKGPFRESLFVYIPVTPLRSVKLSIVTI